MRAGQLRHRVIIQHKTITRNDGGEPIETWANLVTVWGSVEPLRGREYLEAQTQQQAISHRIRIRHPRQSVTPEMRVKFGTRVFEIESALNTGERNIDMTLMCREMI